MIKSVFLAAVSVLFCCVGAGAAGVTFALRMVAPCDAKDASPPMKLEGEEQKFCLQRQVIVEQADVKSAEVTSEQGGKVVRLTLTDVGAKKLLDSTRTNIGNRIGVVLNDRLVSAPVIQAPVSNGIPINGHFTQQEANSIAAAFNREAARQ